MIVKTHLIYISIITGCIVLLGVTNRQYNYEKKTLTESKTAELVIIQHQYNSNIDSYRQKLSSLQQNNIIKTEIVYKKDGDRIVYRTVDKTITKSNEIKNTTSTEVKIADTTNEDLTKDFTKASFIAGSSKVSSNYMIGVGNLQTLSTNLYDHPIIAGVKLPFIPIYTFISVPITSTFYKSTTLSAVMTF